MSINTSAINVGVINGLNGFSYNNTITEAASLTTPTSFTWYAPIVSNIVLTPAFIEILGGLTITESIIQNESVSTSRISNNQIIEVLSILDATIIKTFESITDTVSLSIVLNIVLEQLEEIISIVRLTTTSSSQADLNNIVTNSLTILDSLLKSLKEVVSESVTITEDLLDLYKAIVALEGSIIASSTFDPTTSFFVILENSLLNSDVVNNFSELNNAISEEILLLIPDENSNQKYVAYSFAPETSYITEYNNFNFDSATKFNEKYLFCNSTGLYEYGGSLDHTETVVAEILTSATSFNTTNLKQVPNIYLGITNSDYLLLKVRVDGRGEVHYKLNKFTNNLQTQKVDIGKGLIGRYFQFELITSADTFNLESIEFFPIVLKRKI